MNIRLPGSFILLILLFTTSLSAAESTVSDCDTVFAQRCSKPIKVDGTLNEDIWFGSNCVRTFTQRDPVEGAPATFKSMVYVAYDEQALYIAARLFDPAPDSIITRLARRDEGLDADFFGVFIDPYLDRRTGYYFALSAAGTYLDGVLMNDDWDDDSWDGVWQGEVNIDEQGWTLEMRIPFSQLRFHHQDQYVWGINFRRDIKRRNESDYLVFTPKDGSGFVSRFPLLVGIEDINSSRSLELLPYARAKAEYLNVESENPFNDGSRYIPGFGADLKYGIGNNLTLDGTINPDFGQVEVDPAVVNLSDVETFFPERRPFFIEGSSTFEFGSGGARDNWSFNWSNPIFFYSRRIGRAPQGSYPDHDYADIPDGTRILGAAKLTGNLGDNWKFGTIHAITNREYGDFYYQDNSFQSEIEPLSYYGVVRALKEIDQGWQGLGVMATYTGRNFKNQSLMNEFNKSAMVLGLDGWTFLDSDRTWVITGWGGMSHLRGNTTQMLNLQTSSSHYFQRPDAGHVSVDSSATSMTGYTGRIAINKQKGNVRFNSAFGFMDPGFNINDLGYFWRNDVINGHIGAGYNWTEPTDLYHRFQNIWAVFGSMDFDKNVTWYGIFTNFYIQFLNFYSLEVMFAYNPESVNNRLTRGGPLAINPPGWEFDFWFHSDDRHALSFGLYSFNYIRGPRNWSRSFEAEVEWKVASNFAVMLTPQIMWNKEFTQWVGNFEDPYAIHTYGSRYVFGELDQRELSASIRINWTFTPKLSFQLYLQPLISSGKYNSFKELSEPKSNLYAVYGEGNSNISKSDGIYTVDPDIGGPAQPFEFDDPDFNILSIRANAVMRWEYLPGSVLYLVWTQNRFDNHLDSNFQFRKSFSHMMDLNADNIFMLKLTYWMNI